MSQNYVKLSANLIVFHFQEKEIDFRVIRRGMKIVGCLFCLLIRAVKLIHSFSETCFPSNDFTLLPRGTGSLGSCKEYHLAIIFLCHDAQTDPGSVKTR